MRSSLMSGISILLKETPSTGWGCSQKTPSMNQKVGSHQTPGLPEL